MTLIILVWMLINFIMLYFFIKWEIECGEDIWLDFYTLYLVSFFPFIILMSLILVFISISIKSFLEKIDLSKKIF